MPNLSEINFNGAQRRPTYEGLINCVPYPVRFPDQKATCTRDSPLLRQLDGICMMELQEQERKDKSERHQEDKIRHSAASAKHTAQMLRAMRRRACNAPSGSLTDERSEDIGQVAEEHADEHGEQQRQLHLDRLRRIRDEVHRGMGTDSDIATRMAR